MDAGALTAAWGHLRERHRSTSQARLAGATMQSIAVVALPCI
jgi:hypothetical protein